MAVRPFDKVNQSYHRDNAHGYRGDNEAIDPKALFQFRVQINAIVQQLNPALIPADVVKETDKVIGLALQFHQRLNGEDVPIGVP